MIELSQAEESRRKEQQTKTKTVLLPGTPPEIDYAPPQQTYYEGRSGVPYHNATGTELRKTVRMDESTESTRRVLTVQQTSRVIQFNDQQQFAPTSESYSNVQREEHQQKQRMNVPFPKKFVQGHFKESDYESDIDLARIRAKWAPTDSETEEPRYRKVQPPKTRSRSSEGHSGPIITLPSESENEYERRSRRAEARKSFNENILRPGSPPEYGFASRNEIKTTNRKSGYN